MNIPNEFRCIDIQRDFRFDLGTVHCSNIHVCFSGFAGISQKHCTLDAQMFGCDWFCSVTACCCSFVCLVFFADHCWLCCVEVSADIEPLEYTPKPECPVERCFQNHVIHTISWGEGRTHVPVRMLGCFVLQCCPSTASCSRLSSTMATMDHATCAIIMK